jgi:hypothetical protein
MIRRTLFGCLLTAILSSCSAGTGMFGPSTGTVTGHVQLRACGGAYRPDQTGCPAHPDAGVRLTFLLDPAGAKGSATTTTTDANGAYRVVLSPGTYTVRATLPSASSTAAAAPGRFGGPTHVTVTADKTVTADFSYTIELL